jgi:hypothetical protein
MEIKFRKSLMANAVGVRTKLARKLIEESSNIWIMNRKTLGTHLTGRHIEPHERLQRRAAKRRTSFRLSPSTATERGRFKSRAQWSRRLPSGGRGDAEVQDSNASDSFRQQAAELLAQHLAVRPGARKVKAHPKVAALHGLIAQIVKQMKRLSLAQRMKFFASSVVIVAEVLAAMQRKAPHNPAGRPYRLSSMGSLRARRTER